MTEWERASVPSERISSKAPCHHNACQAWKLLNQPRSYSQCYELRAFSCGKALAGAVLSLFIGLVREDIALPGCHQTLEYLERIVTAERNMGLSYIGRAPKPP